MEMWSCPGSGTGVAVGGTEVAVGGSEVGVALCVVGVEVTDEATEVVLERLQAMSVNESTANAMPTLGAIRNCLLFSSSNA